MKNLFAIRHIVDGEKHWATGEFSREHPPSSYIGDWNEVMILTEKKVAQEFADEFGGEVVEFELKEVV